MMRVFSSWTQAQLPWLRGVHTAGSKATTLGLAELTSKSIWFKVDGEYKLRVEELCRWRNFTSNVFAQKLLLFITIRHTHMASVFTAVAQLTCCVWMIRYSTGIKLREYIFYVFSPQGQERVEKKLQQTETNHRSKIKLLNHITNPHGNITKYQAG